MSDVQPVQITLTRGATVRKLNGLNAQGSADEITWTSIINGGHENAAFRVPYSEYNANKALYKYGTRVEYKVAPNATDAGTALYTGYMLTPVVTIGVSTVTIDCQGYGQLFRDTKDPLLWLTFHYADWTDLNSKPFGGSFANNAQALSATVKGGSLDFSIQSGQTASANDNAGVGFYLDDDVWPTRVQGYLHANGPVPNSNYSLKVYDYTGPTNPGSGRIFNGVSHGDLTSKLNNLAKGSPQSFDTLGLTNNQASGYPVMTIEITRTTGTGATGSGWEVWITDLAMNGNAYQGGRSPSLTYNSHNPVLDMAALLGFSTGKVQTTTTDCLPLFNQSGTAWSDTMDHLTHIMSGTNGWKWGVWDWVSGAPEVEFRDYATGNTTWTTNAYTSAATSIAAIDTVPADLFNKVIVTYHVVHHKRKHKYVAHINPNPFAGLDAPLANRARSKHYHIHEPLPTNSGLPKVIGDNLALKYSTEHYGGTITATSLSTGGNSKWAGEARAGQLLTIADFPNNDGSTGRTFRISQVDGAAADATVITIGDIPYDLGRLMWRLHEKARDHGERGLHH